MGDDKKNILRYALWGGIVTTMIIFLGTYLMGKVSSTEAIANLREIRPSIRFTCSSVMTATATILALLLTLLSFAHNTDKRLKSWHYERIHWIGRFAIGAFAGAMILLMLLNLPLENADESMKRYYSIVYYALLSYSAILGGAMITIIVLLYEAARDMIMLFRPDSNADYLYKTEAADNGEETKQQEEKKQQAEA